MIHEIKISPHNFIPVWDAKQAFTIVKNTRILKHEFIVLREYSDQSGFTGRRLNALVTDVYHSENASGEGLKKGFSLILLSDFKKIDKRYQTYTE